MLGAYYELVRVAGVLVVVDETRDVARVDIVLFKLLADIPVVEQV
jgi:hypothetical protein